MPHDFIDGHLDLAYLALNGRDMTAEPPADAAVTLPTLRRGHVRIAFATIFTEPGCTAPEGYPDSNDRDAAFEAGKRQLDVYLDWEARNLCRIIRTQQDLELDSHDDTPAFVILMEGADPICSPDDVAWWYEHGLRIVGLTWAMGTRYAGGNAAHRGLSDEGRALVRALDEHHIAHDVSHLADQAFDDLLECARGTVMATHSNCRALVSDNQRHLTDDQIRRLSERRAVIGLNLYTKFIHPERRATLDDCLNHIEHTAQHMGRRNGVGLGSDMDGGLPASELPVNIDHPEKLEALAEGLAERGWTDTEIKGFRTENWRTLLKTFLPT